MDKSACPNPWVSVKTTYLKQEVLKTRLYSATNTATNSIYFKKESDTQQT
jgi:hypothetical protein